MNIVKFDAASGSNLPAYLQSGAVDTSINDDVVTAAAFPSLSIKGKRFAISRDGVKTVIMKPSQDGDDPEPAQSLGVVILRANMNAKTYYAKRFNEADSDGARPDCYSFDGISPSPNAGSPQSAKCAVCPHNAWGSRVSEDAEAGEERKGKACSDNARLAISAPDKMDPMLVRVPPASLKGLRETLKIVKQRKIPYNAVVVRLGFDVEAASPKLTFKPIGLLDDSGYASANALYEDDTVRAIVGVDDVGHGEAALPAPTKAPSVNTDELDAALAARAVSDRAASSAKAAPAKAKPKVDEDDFDDLIPKAAAPAPAPAPAKAKPQADSAPPKSGSSSLLDSLDDLLKNKDD